MYILPGARAARGAAILREESIVRQFAIAVPGVVSIDSAGAHVLMERGIQQDDTSNSPGLR